MGVRYSITPAPISTNGIQPAVVDYARLPIIVPVQPPQLWSTDLFGFSPRVGISYQMRAQDASTTILRAGWSSITDEMTSPGGIAMGRGAPYISSRQALVEPSAIVEPTPRGMSVRSEYFAFPKRLTRPRTTERYLAIEHGLDRTQTIGLMYVATAARDLIYWHAYPDSSGQLAVNAYSNDGRSTYHGLLAHYTRRSSGRWQSRVAYTWSHAIDLDSGEQPAPNVPPLWQPPSINKGSADFDRRHVLAATFNYAISPSPSGRRRFGLLIDDWNLAASLTARSGTPFSVLYTRSVENGPYLLRMDLVPGEPLWLEDSTSPSGQRLNPDAFVAPDGTRQGLLGRNTLVGRGVCQVDLSLSKSFRIGRVANSVRVDVFNIMNRPSSGPPNGDFSQSNFGRTFESYADALGKGTLSGGGLPPLQQIGGPRSLQLVVKAAF